MEYYFIENGFKYEIKTNTVDKIFPVLNAYHKNLLFEYLINIIDVIAIKFNFDLNNRYAYEYQFRQNNYKDAVGLLFMLLPYIDDTFGTKSKTLTSLNELYIAKKDNIKYDINLTEPKYEYTNLQYGRCIRDNDIAREISFSEDHLKHNYLLLLDTIKNIANKLYVNWINIRPIDAITATDINYIPYYETKKRIFGAKLIDWNPFIEANDKDNKENKEGKFDRSMSVGEIYNIVSNYLFDEIKNIKWLLYDVYINRFSHKYLYFLNDILNIENCAKNIKWNLLSEKEQNDFNYNLNTLIDTFIKESTYGNLSRNNVQYIITVLIFFFNKYYTNKEEIKKDGYKELQDDIEEIDDDMVLSKLTLDNYRVSAKSLKNNGKHIYEYICESLYELRFTWYSKFYLNYNKELKVYELNKISSSDMGSYGSNGSNGSKKSTKKFSIKNVYNFAKSLISYTDPNEKNKNKSYKQFPKHWKSLSSEDKKVILNRLNSRDGLDSNNVEWFTIVKYLKIGVNYTQDEAIKVNTEIINNIFKYLPDILFDILASNGLLSEFVPDARLTDQSILPKSTSDRNTAIQEKLSQYVINNPNLRERWEKSIYFINNLEYGWMEMTEKIDGILEKYIDLLCNPKTRIGSWVYVYGMDWICQIGFFHHYLNNRVIYITGGTGDGTSTQVPKLLLYSLKMLDYKTSGKIACTQPRVPPTVNNAKTISSQMGIPIESYNKSINSDIVTNNYYIQYKHQKKKHSMKQKGLVLEIMTDGTLEINLKNPVLKSMIGNNYSTNNIYDIVIVDEAHEHNKNMDLILTRMKYAAYYNNSIKLVIISATMEDDEPVYRRYYRDINDNKMFPLNLSLKEHNLDRINVDRRIHISPPGEVTQYKINEIYTPLSSGMHDKNQLLETIKRTVLNIIRTSPDGDLLVFQPGEGEIKTTVTELNKITPKDVIALPYFSALNDTKKTMVEEINKYKYNLTIPKDIPFEEDLDETQYKPVLPGTYKRVIIVGTNIAEASITISTLRYVIETGTQKTNIYDYNTRSAQLLLTEISESSRLQRKGRVGRVAPGTVYYLYKKGSKENIKKRFNISIEDFSDKLFEMLSSTPKDEAFFDSNNDPNKNIINIKNITRLYKYDLCETIREQYFTKDSFYDYYGSDKQYDYKNASNMFIYYKTGFDKETLDDREGSFYIVHPDELCFTRNIMGKLVHTPYIDITCAIKQKIIDDKILYKSYKMETFWNILKEYLFIVEDSNTKIVYKTDFGNNIIKMKTKLTRFNLQQLISYIYSRKYNCQDDILKLFAMHSTVRSLSELIYVKPVTENGKTMYKNTLEQAMVLYGNCNGDSYGLIKICNDIIKFYTNDLLIIKGQYPKPIGEIINYKKSRSIKDELQNDKKRFINSIKENKFNYKGMDKDVLFNLSQLYNTNKLSVALNDQISENELDKLMSSGVIIDKYISGFKEQEYEQYIKKWCIDRYLNYTSVSSFFKNYLNLLGDVIKCENKIDDNDYEVTNEIQEDISWFNSHTPQLININEIDKNDLIKIALLNGYGYNLMRNISNINNISYYISIFNPQIDNILKIGKTFTPKKPTTIKIPNNTFIFNKCVGNTLLYISKKEDDSDEENMNFIDNINPMIISRVIPQIILNIDKYNIMDHEKYISFYLNMLTINRNSNPLVSKFVNNYVRVIESIKLDLLNNQDKNVYEKISVIMENTNDKKYIRDLIAQTNRLQSGGEIEFTKKINTSITNSYINALVLLLNKKY